MSPPCILPLYCDVLSIQYLSKRNLPKIKTWKWNLGNACFSVCLLWSVAEWRAREKGQNYLYRPFPLGEWTHPLTSAKHRPRLKIASSWNLPDSSLLWTGRSRGGFSPAAASQISPTSEEFLQSFDHSEGRQKSRNSLHLSLCTQWEEPLFI